MWILTFSIIFRAKCDPNRSKQVILTPKQLIVSKYRLILATRRLLRSLLLASIIQYSLTIRYFGLHFTFVHHFGIWAVFAPHFDFLNNIATTSSLFELFHQACEQYSQANYVLLFHFLSKRCYYSLNSFKSPLISVLRTSIWGSFTHFAGFASRIRVPTVLRTFGGASLRYILFVFILYGAF